MGLIIQPEDVGVLSRPISQHIDKMLLTSYISEVEDSIIRRAIGDKLLRAVKEFPDEYEDILTDDELTGGLRKAVAYYVYANLVKRGEIIVTRFGAVEKNDEYSTRLEHEKRNATYRDSMRTADMYLSIVVMYAKNTGLIDTEQVARKSVYVIGDGDKRHSSVNVKRDTRTEKFITSDGEEIYLKNQEYFRTKKINYGLQE